MAESERAVSDVLGFVLVASLIFATLGVVFVAGMAGLEDARGAERVVNAERAFAVLADNVQDIRAEGAPSRATEIKLANAQLSFGRSTTLSVNVTNTAATENPVFSTSLDPIVYTAGTGSRIVYENGGLLRVDRESAVLKRRPPGVFSASGSTSAATIQYVQTRQAGPASVGGESTVLVRANHVSTEVLGSLNSPAADGAGDLDGDGSEEYALEYTITTTPARAVVWTEYLNGVVAASGNRTAFDNHDVDGDGARADDPVCSRTGGTVTCELMVERINVAVTRIDVIFE